MRYSIGDQAWVVITTRAGARKNGERLPPEYGGVNEALNRRIWLSFYHDSLEGAMVKLSDELGFPIAVRDGDLPLESLNLRTSFGIYETDKPIREILRRILTKCSPEEKLVYIIKSLPDGAEEVFITARAAAIKNGETLPPEYGRINDLLSQKTTLAFGRYTMKDAFQVLSINTGIPITIREHDLKLEGFTDSNEREIREVDLPAREILVKILKTFSDDDKFVYIIKPKPDNSGAEVVITTRAAVAKSGETLPSEFDGIKDRLNNTTTLSFDKNTMEIALQILSLKADVPISIRRQDLELAGVAWDRQRGIHEVDQPVRQILMKILELFTDDKIVFIIQRKPDGSGEEVIVTTRAAVEKNGEQLPPEFEK